MLLHLLRELPLVPVIALTLIVGDFISPAFLTVPNMTNMLQSSAVLGVVVVAETLVLLAGKFDLSLESIVGIAPMVGAYLLLSKDSGGAGIQMNAYLAILLMLAVGAAVGLFNGWLIVRLRMNAFMVTLAMLILLRGVTIGLTSGQTLSGLPNVVVYLGQATWFGVPVSVVVAGGIFLVAGVFLRYHRLGRALYMIGGNDEAARAAGVRVDRVLWAAFIVAGLLAALAGLMLTGRVASVSGGQGQNLIFTTMAAAVVGGVSLNGGKGTMLGALTGVLLLGLITNLLTLSEIQSFWIDAADGAVILLALGVAHLAAGGRSGD